MAINFYVGGTAGGADGTLVSSGDGSAPIQFNGMYPSSGAPAVRCVPVCVRTDGATYQSVMIAVKTVGSTNRIGVSKSTATADQSNFTMLNLGKVSTTNVMFYAIAAAYFSDTVGSDTTVDLIAWAVA